MYRLFLPSLFLAIMLAPRAALAIAPNYISDQDLALVPIIVEAVWEKAAFKEHVKYADAEKTTVSEWETYTQLRVLRTVRGPALPAGEHQLMVNWGISWEADGTSVRSGTSTDVPGDVDDITRPQLWFLHRAKSWDENRLGDFLAIDNYRKIQPLKFEAFYTALGSLDRDLVVPKLLAVKDGEVQVRALKAICGGEWPWPYDPGEFSRLFFTPETNSPRLVAAAPQVLDIIQSDLQDARPRAVSVYAELAGKSALPQLRALLNDRNSEVRAVAAGWLSRYRDTKSYSQIAFSLQGLDEERVIQKVIDELSAHRGEQFVPCLIPFLEHDSTAVQTRQMLRKITGIWFPFESARSLAVWEQAESLADRAARNKLLTSLVPSLETPLRAELIGEITKILAQKTGDDEFEETDQTAVVRLMNTSKYPVTILKKPSEVSMNFGTGGGGFGWMVPRSKAELKKDEFVTLAAGSSLEIKIPVFQSFVRSDPEKRELQLGYANLGNAFGANPWIGELSVELGPSWKKRNEVKVEKLWPNGNLMETGQTVNGERYGEWNFYNEAGDRIRISYYQQGRGTSELNPDHPINKGAGIRKE